MVEGNPDFTGGLVFLQDDRWLQAFWFDVLTERPGLDVNDGYFSYMRDPSRRFSRNKKSSRVSGINRYEMEGG
jgi:hypothetical protein